MDEKLQELLNELVKELGGDINVNTAPANINSQQQTNAQPHQTFEQTQDDKPEENQTDYDYQTQMAWENWKQYGRTAFISRGDPKVLKYMPLIEQRAEYKLQMDLAKNQIKDSYLQYLQEAYNEILVELAGIVKDFLPSRQIPNYYGYFGASNQPETPAYTMKDYFNDYKKALEYATYKNMGMIYYKDSSDKGKYGEGKLRLGESLDELNI